MSRYRHKQVHRGGDPLPEADDLVWQYGPRGLMLCSTGGGHIVAREPFDLGAWQ